MRSNLTVIPGTNWLHEPDAARTVRVSGGGIAASTRVNIDLRNSFSQTLGLDAWLRLTSPTARPSIHIAEHVVHPFATQQREGVDEQEVVGWLHAVGVFR